MKAVLASIYACVFIITMLIGYRLGEQYTAPVTSAQSEIDFPLPGLTDIGQMNLLIVSTDRLEAIKPELQVIWLVALDPSSSIKFLPVYPSGQVSQNDSALLEAFGIQKNKGQYELNPATQQILQDQGITWAGSLILDNHALADFIDAFGEITVGNYLLDRDELANHKLPELHTSQFNINFHTMLWRELCWNILHDPEKINQLDKNFNRHASFNFPDYFAGQDWPALLASARIPTCEFPQFTQSSP